MVWSESLLIHSMLIHKAKLRLQVFLLIPSIIHPLAIYLGQIDSCSSPYPDLGTVGLRQNLLCSQIRSTPKHTCGAHHLDSWGVSNNSLYDELGHGVSPKRLLLHIMTAVEAGVPYIGKWRRRLDGEQRGQDHYDGDNEGPTAGPCSLWWWGPAVFFVVVEGGTANNSRNPNLVRRPDLKRRPAPFADVRPGRGARGRLGHLEPARHQAEEPSGCANRHRQRRGGGGARCCTPCLSWYSWWGPVHVLTLPPLPDAMHASFLRSEDIWPVNLLVFISHVNILPHRQGLHMEEAFFYYPVSLLFSSIMQPFVLMSYDPLPAGQLLLWRWFDDFALTWVFGSSFSYLRQRHQQHTSVAGMLFIRQLRRTFLHRRYARPVLPGARVFDAPANTPHRHNRPLLRFSRCCILFWSQDRYVFWSSFEDHCVLWLLF